MPRTGLSKEEILNKSIELANQKGINYLSVTTLSNALGIKKPSLYYHAQTVEEVIQWIMIYGWQKVSTEIVAKAENENPETSIKNKIATVAYIYCTQRLSSHYSTYLHVQTYTFASHTGILRYQSHS